MPSSLHTYTNLQAGYHEQIETIQTVFGLVPGTFTSRRGLDVVTMRDEEVDVLIR